ncbi:hypothetical protein SAMN05444161_7283 [Rhizobiales bacterium GAS191]|nr:hypothetical protein SAMN05444161_7283 [Rhizobiales bacterium GAS191]
MSRHVATVTGCSFLVERVGKMLTARTRLIGKGRLDGRQPNATARAKHAFAAARSARPSDATFELLPDLSLIRHGAVHVAGPSRTEAIAAAEPLSQTIVAAFDGEGPGQLDVSVRRRAEPSWAIDRRRRGLRSNGG